MSYPSLLSNFKFSPLDKPTINSYPDTQKLNTLEVNQEASLFHRLFMIPREIPDYLSTAHALRFPESPSGENIFKKYYRIFIERISLIKEILGYRPSSGDFQKNIRRLDSDFQKINQKIGNDSKPICAYFVSSYDTNGAILGDHLYYYHNYKIKGFENHYSVAAKVAKNTNEMFEFLGQLKSQFPDREIEVVDGVCHGDPTMLAIKKTDGNFYEKSDVKEDEFKNCAKDAVIILDACSAGAGKNSIADEIAKKNPGKRVIAPGTSLFFSKPIITQKGGKSLIEHVVHGFAVFNAYTSKQFKYTQ